MDQRISFLSLAVRDLETSRRFYVDGLGWQPAFEQEGEVVMFEVAEKVVLSLWAESGFEEEVGPVRRGSGIVPITLAHNLPTREEVDAVLADARAAGAAEVSDGVEREWGGYTGYFADPDGFRWEIAFNPGDAFRFLLP